MLLLSRQREDKAIGCPSVLVTSWQFREARAAGRTMSSGLGTGGVAVGQLFCSAANSTLYLETFRHWLLLRPRGDADEWIACTLQEKYTANA